MTPFDLLLLALATWYLAYSAVKLAGPFGVFTWLREWRGGRWHGRTYEYDIRVGNGDSKALQTNGALDCIYCISLYVAIGFALLWLTPARPLVYPFALAGAALMLHRYTGGMHT